VLTDTGGLGRLIEPTALERRDIRAGALGLGLHSSIDMPNGFQGGAFGIEAARQYSDLPLLAHGWRFNVSLNIKY
jgi:hypothetical protein